MKHGEESLVSRSVLIPLGDLLEAAKLKDRLSQINIHRDRRKYIHADIAFAVMALSSIGKPDYDAVECVRANPRFLSMMHRGCRAARRAPPRARGWK